MTRAASRDPQEEIVALLAIQLRLSLGSQTAAVVEMSKAGFPTSRIAELLGTTPNVVNVTLQKKKAAAKPKPAKPASAKEGDGA